MQACAGGKPGVHELTVYTLGDSILDCGSYNQYGVDPGQLLVRNDDGLFPEFRGQDISSVRTARLVHRARDGAMVQSLPEQVKGLNPPGPSLTLLTIGGNDLLRGLVSDNGPGMQSFERTLDGFLRRLQVGPLLLGNVYDPTFGDDSRNFLGVDPALGRANLQRMNDVLARLARKYGTLVDLHAHFLKGDPSWFTNTIEPSLTGASEVRRAFLPPALSTIQAVHG
jgi:acyl-CoA thioesterase I